MEDKVSAKLLVEIAESIKLTYPPKLENLDRLRALRHLVSFISVEQVAVISTPIFSQHCINNIQKLSLRHLVLLISKILPCQSYV